VYMVQETVEVAPKVEPSVWALEKALEIVLSQD
jgi:hypothetical protein